MRTWNRALLAALGAVASAAAMAATPGAGLLGTAHDFASGIGTHSAAYLLTQGGSNGAGDPVSSAANQVGLCTYCHTPHSALSTQLLWNHKMSTNTFTWDVTTTTGGTAFASIAPTYKGPTVRCLSCHDGSVAIGDANLFVEGTPTNLNTFKITNPFFKIANGPLMAKNHPVAMPYPLGNVPNTYNAITNGGEVVLADFRANPHAPATSVKLYKDDGVNITGGTAAGTTGIECSSCHDPHNKQTQGDLFLRGKLAGSTQADGYLCLQCHIK